MFQATQIEASAGQAPAVEELVVDAEVATPQGSPCPACGSPIEPDERFCPACGTPQHPEAVVEAVVVEETPHAFFRCQGCGSEVATDPGQRSYVCPFCDSTYVVEFSPQETGRQRPEFVIGFALTPEQAQTRFSTWLGRNSWFRPGDLKMAQITDRLKGVYLPFWTFSMLAESQWRADIGEYWYRTETYTTRDSKGKLVTRTRRVRETEWWPLAGRYHRYHSGYLLSGSRGLSQRDSQRIQPFQLPALKRYSPAYLAGWLCEEYSVSREEALTLCRQEFERRQQQQVAAFLPGDTQRGLSLQTQFSHVNSDLCLLPVYVLSYRYRDRVYRFLLNGQTGKCDGDKPVSAGRITAVVVGGLILLLLLVLLFAMLGGA